MSAQDAPPLLREGSTFAQRYRVGSLLGRGGMGEVYAAHDLELDEPVALKLVILGACVPDPQSAVQNFRSEVRLARRVSHRNVIRIHDLGQADGQQYLTMELMDGIDLRALLVQRVILPPDEAAAIARQIAEGLAAAHAADVVHRDLKPGNILVDGKRRVKITDFGIARLIAAGDAAEQTNVSGTPAYMAPEQSAGGAITDRVDIYALGLILHELLNGLRSRAPKPNPGNDPTSRALRAIVGDCLSALPSARPSAAELVTRLQNLTSGDGSLKSYVIPSASSAQETPTAAVAVAPVTPVTAPQQAPKRLALIPFAAPPTHADLARALTSELADVLSRTRGLRVRTLHESAAGDHSTPSLLNQLSADFAVEGRLSVIGGRVRIEAKVLDGRTGDQLFRERLEDELEAAVQMQEALGGRIAEALRVGFSTFANAGLAGPEATALYLRARSRMLTFQFVGSDGALRLLDKCLELSPHFKPALAARAAAEARAQFTTGPEGKGRAQSAVAQALAEAGDLPETRVAAAAVALHHAEYKDAVAHLQAALLSAPSCGEAHMMLGIIQGETGREEEALESLKLAVELVPEHAVAQGSLGRLLALRGDSAASESWYARIPKQLRGAVPVLQVVARVAGWTGNFEHHRALFSQAAAVSTGGMAKLLVAAMRRTLGEIDAAELDDAFRPMQPAFASEPRVAATLYEVGAEAEGVRGDVENCLRHVRAMSSLGVHDLIWLQRCPALACVRSTAEFKRIEAEAVAAAQTVWS